MNKVEEFSLACEENRLEKVRDLVPIVGVNCKDVWANTGLMWATVGKSLPVFYFLLSQPGLDINITDDEFGNTVLHDATKNDVEEMVQALATRADMNLDIKNKKGETAKDIAAAKGYHHLETILDEAEKSRREGILFTDQKENDY